MGNWAIRNPLKIHCYTCISFETCWSRRIYTKLSAVTPVICHKHVRYHDAVFLREVSIGRSKEDEKWIFFIYFSRFPLSEVKTTKQKKTKKKQENFDWTLVNTESINRNLSAALLHVKLSCNRNLNDIGISLQRADSGSYHFLETETKIFRIIWKLSENCQKNCKCGDWVLHIVLPLTSCDFCSQILSVYERSIALFFFWVVFT